MSFIPSNVVPFVTAPASRDPAQATDWARRQLKGRLSIFNGVTAGPAPALATAASAAFDVLTSAAAFLASAKSARTANELSWQIDAYHCDWTQDALGGHTAGRLAAILSPLIREAARTLRLRRLINTQTALIGVFHQSLTAFIVRDPDLHAMPVLALYNDLYRAVAAADPRRAVVVLWDLHELIGSAVDAANAPVAPPPPQPTNVPDDCVIEFRTDIKMPATDIEATIARLDARRMAFDASSAQGERTTAWIAERLRVLHSQKRVVERTSAPV